MVPFKKHVLRTENKANKNGKANVGKEAKPKQPFTNSHTHTHTCTRATLTALGSEWCINDGRNERRNEYLPTPAHKSYVLYFYLCSSSVGTKRAHTTKPIHLMAHRVCMCVCCFVGMRNRFAIFYTTVDMCVCVWVSNYAAHRETYYSPTLTNYCGAFDMLIQSSDKFTTIVKIKACGSYRRWWHK